MLRHPRPYPLLPAPLSSTLLPGRGGGAGETQCAWQDFGVGPSARCLSPKKHGHPPHAEWLLSASATGQLPGTTPRAVIMAGGLVGPEAPKPTPDWSSRHRSRWYGWNPKVCLGGCRLPSL